MLIPDIERRRRLVRRHHLPRAANDEVQAVRGVAAFHATDPLTPYLGMWGRVPSFTTRSLDRVLWDDRSLWRLHAMRRTLFLVPTDDAPVFLGGASAGIAAKERTRLEGWLAKEMPEERVGPWLDSVTTRLLGLLGAGGEWSTRELSEAVPDLGRRIMVGSGKWAAESPVSSRLLFLLGMEGRIVRTRPAGSWRSSQYRWAAASVWWRHPPTPMEDAAAARSELMRRYLAGHGPATLADIRWWTGWTVREVGTALEWIDAAAVTLENGTEGYVLAGDTEADDPAGGTAAFLPGLDPTPMGWKERGWYLGTRGDLLFDRNGNVGPTVWVDGRVVGGWAQHPDGTVVYELLEDTGATAAVGEEAARLTEWLDGQVVSIRFKTPLERKLAQA